jgi:hypothetical protein
MSPLMMKSSGVSLRDWVLIFFLDRNFKLFDYTRPMIGQTLNFKSYSRTGSGFGVVDLLSLSESSNNSIINRIASFFSISPKKSWVISKILDSVVTRC